MNPALLIFLGFSNLLIATAVAFVFSFLLKMRALGGYWVVLVIALIGSFSGTVLGIFFESRRFFENFAFIRFIVPIFISAILVFIFLKISQWHSNE